MTPGLGPEGWPGIGGQFGAGRRPSCGRRSVTGARYGRRPIRSHEAGRKGAGHSDELDGHGEHQGDDEESTSRCGAS